MRTTLVIYIALMIGQGSWGSSDPNNTVSETPLQESELEGVAGRTEEIEIQHKDFNFHNKSLFLKQAVRNLVECIQKSLADNPDRPLPYPETLLMSDESNLYEEKPPDKPRFVFKYNGSRGYNETCLGDGYKRDLLYRVYDCGSGDWSYEKKINYLDSFSCDARKYLECRWVGEETERAYAEQATPIMRCLCPDYDQPQTPMNATKGFYSTELEKCVLKAGQKCTFEARGLDNRTTWIDSDFVDAETNRTWIEVIDLRPLGNTYQCVKNSFCYTNDTNGLTLKDAYKDRCVCTHRNFQTPEGNCTNILEDSPEGGVLMALAFVIIAITVFTAGITTR